MRRADTQAVEQAVDAFGMAVHRSCSPVISEPEAPASTRSALLREVRAYGEARYLDGIMVGMTVRKALVTAAVEDDE